MAYQDTYTSMVVDQILEPMLLGALAGIELALAEAGMPHSRGGVKTAMNALRETASRKTAPVAS